MLRSTHQQPDGELGRIMDLVAQSSGRGGSRRLSKRQRVSIINFYMGDPNPLQIYDESDFQESTDDHYNRDDEGWSQLLDEVLGEIGLRIYLFEDFINFSTVCRSWRRAATMVKSHCRQQPIMRSRQMPWIMHSKSAFDRKAFFYNPNKGSNFQSSCLEADTIRFWGSSYGWITMVDKSFNIHVYDPLRRWIRRHSLPNLKTLPIRAFMSTFRARRKGYMFATRLFVLKTSAAEDDAELFLAVALMGEGKYLSFAGAGDEAWIPVELGNRGVRVADVTYWDGLLLIAYEDGAVAYVDPINKAGMSGRPVKTIDYLPCPDQLRMSLMEDNPRKTSNKLYIVESSGSLLMICRHRIKTRAMRSCGVVHYVIETTRFEIYMLDRQNMKWKATNNLQGDVALFVGDTGSMSVYCASEVDNCKPNCIYFNDDETYTWRKMVEYSMGLYNMEDDIIQSFYKLDCTISPKLYFSWFMPMTAR